MAISAERYNSILELPREINNQIPANKLKIENKIEHTSSKLL